MSAPAVTTPVPPPTVWASSSATPSAVLGSSAFSLVAGPTLDFDGTPPPPAAPPVPPAPVTAPGSGLPLVFTGLIRSKLDDVCLIFSDNGQDRFPSRYDWGGDPAYCGLSSKAELLSNKQPLWTFTNVGDDNYIITNGSAGIDQCLIFSGNGTDTNPSRYNWGDGSSAVNCGFDTKADLLANKQAVFRILKVSDTAFQITNASQDQEMCLIFSDNGNDFSPSRYNWNGTALNCGWPDMASMLANKQAAWSIEPL